MFMSMINFWVWLIKGSLLFLIYNKNMPTFYEQQPNHVVVMFRVKQCQYNPEAAVQRCF